jgi:hypothetical protein
MQFDVTIQRTEYREHVFRVEADDRDGAWHAGLKAAEDYDFNDSPISSAGEEPIGIYAIPPNAPVRRGTPSPPVAGSPMTDLPWGCPYCGQRFKYAEEGIVHSDNCKRSPANGTGEAALPAKGDA